jgi:hypothetical protein
MRINIKTIIIVLSILCTFAVSSMAVNDQVSSGGARPLGLGGAFTAVADDINTVTINPAGLPLLSGLQIQIMGSPEILGLNDGGLIRLSAIAALPMNIAGSIGISVNYFNAFFDRESLYNETDITFSYAYPVLRKLNIGFSINYLGWKARAEEFNGLVDNVTGGSFFSLSAGLLWLASERVKIGLAAHDFYTTKTDTVRRADNPFAIRLGISALFKRSLLALDVEYKNYSVNIAVGTEFKIGKHFFLRSGLNLRNVIYGVDLSLGMGYKIKMFRADYGFMYPFSLGSLGTHRLALNYITDFQVLKSKKRWASRFKIEQVVMEKQGDKDTYLAFGKIGQYAVMQQFKASSTNLGNITVMPGPNKGEPDNNVLLKIYNTGTDGLPSGKPILEHKIKGKEWNKNEKSDFAIPVNTALKKDRVYCIVFDVDEYDKGDNIRSISGLKSDSYPGDLYFLAGAEKTWTIIERELYFKNIYNKVKKVKTEDDKYKYIVKTAKGPEAWEGRMPSAAFFGGGDKLAVLQEMFFLKYTGPMK